MPPTNYFWSQVRQLCQLAGVPAVLSALAAWSARDAGIGRWGDCRCGGTRTGSRIVCDDSAALCIRNSVDNAKASKVSSLPGSTPSSHLSTADMAKQATPNPNPQPATDDSDQLIRCSTSLPADKLAAILSRLAPTG